MTSLPHRVRDAGEGLVRYLTAVWVILYPVFYIPLAALAVAFAPSWWEAVVQADCLTALLGLTVYQLTAPAPYEVSAQNDTDFADVIAGSAYKQPAQSNADT